MTEPRLSTVFDYSDLRLHPDGTRVYQKASNRRPVLAKVIVQDARANWIAKDAGGSARVRKYRKRARKSVSGEDVDAEVIDISREVDDEAGGEKRADEEVGVQSGEEGSDTSQLRRKRAARKPPDQRKFKRRKFEASYEYLEPNEPRAKSTDVDAISEAPSISNTFPTEPSPDLLKVIHRFASEFYTERGQLLNISREYRKERKKRALERKAKSLDGGSSRSSKKKASLSRSQSLSSSSDSDGDFSVRNADELSENEAERRRKLKGKGKATERDSETRGASADRDQDGGEDEDHGEEALNDETDEIESDSDADSKRSTQRKRRKKRGREKILPALYTDMYKVFDGSAMMALGMLVQEHIASLLNPEVPENWIKEVKSVYTEDLSSGDEEEGDEQFGPEGEDFGDGDEQEEDEEAEDSDADEDDEEDEEDEKGQEEGEDEMDEEDELLDEEGDDDNWDEGDDKHEHRNENEHRINPYLPASSRTHTQDNIIHADSEPFTYGERTTGSGLEEDDVDPMSEIPEIRCNGVIVTTASAMASHRHDFVRTPPQQPCQAFQQHLNMTSTLPQFGFNNAVLSSHIVSFMPSVSMASTPAKTPHELHYESDDSNQIPVMSRLEPPQNPPPMTFKPIASFSLPRKFGSHGNIDSGSPTSTKHLASIAELETRVERLEEALCRLIITTSDTEGQDQHRKHSLEEIRQIIEPEKRQKGIQFDQQKPAEEQELTKKQRELEHRRNVSAARKQRRAWQSPDKKFTGEIEEKSLVQLGDLAHALRLSPHGTKNDLILRIHRHFDMSPALRQDPRYFGLFLLSNSASHQPSHQPTLPVQPPVTSTSSADMLGQESVSTPGSSDFYKNYIQFPNLPSESDESQSLLPDSVSDFYSLSGIPANFGF